MAQRSVERALAQRHTEYTDEVERLIRAALVVMRKADTDSPRIGDILTEAGLSNQTFYRHFRSKEEFLLAVLDDGLRQLLSYLEHELAKEDRGVGQIRRWVAGIMTQAMNPDAAASTRGVLANSSQLMSKFADQFSRSEDVIKIPLRHAILLASEQGDVVTVDLERDVEAIYRMVMGLMQAALGRRTDLEPDDVEHAVLFIYRALGVAPGTTTAGSAGEAMA